MARIDNSTHSDLRETRRVDVKGGVLAVAFVTFHFQLSEAIAIETSYDLDLNITITTVPCSRRAIQSQKPFISIEIVITCNDGGLWVEDGINSLVRALVLVDDQNFDENVILAVITGMALPR